MSELESVKTPAGIGAEDLAVAARGCCMRLTNRADVADWIEVSDDVKTKWRNAANLVFNHYLLETKVSFSSLAQQVAEKVIGTGIWKTRPPVYHLMWEAITRHLANLISAEDIYEIQEAHNNDWSEWILERLTKQTEPKEVS